jgi:predicted site-specific integrase-resolvase
MPAAKKPAPRYGSYADAAALAKVSTDTIKRWARAGKVRVDKQGASNRALVNLDDIEKLIARNASAA